MSKFTKRKLEQQQEQQEREIDVIAYLRNPDMLIPKLMKLKEEPIMSSIYRFILELLGLQNYFEENKCLSLKDVRLIFEHMIGLIKIGKDAGIDEETLKKIEFNTNHQQIQHFFTTILVSDIPKQLDKFLPSLVDFLYVIGNQSVRILRKSAIELLGIIHNSALNSFKVNPSKEMDQFIFQMQKYIINYRLNDKCPEIQIKARNIVFHVLKTSHLYIKTENYHKVIGVLLNEQNEEIVYTTIEELILSLQNPETDEHFIENTMNILQVNQGFISVLLFKENTETQLRGLQVFKYALKQTIGDYYLLDYTRLCLFRQLIGENYRIRYAIADFLEQINPELKKNFRLQSSQELIAKMIQFQCSQYHIKDSNHEDISYKFMSAIIPHFEYALQFQSYLELIKSRQLDEQREYILLLNLSGAIKFGQQIENLVAQYQMGQFSQEKINKIQQSQEKLSIIFYENIEILIPLYQSSDILKKGVLIFLSNLKQEKQNNDSIEKLFNLVYDDFMNKRFKEDDVKLLIDVMIQFANDEGLKNLEEFKYKLINKYYTQSVTPYQIFILRHLLRIGVFNHNDQLFTALEQSKDYSTQNLELIGQYIECLVKENIRNMSQKIVNNLSDLLQNINQLVWNYLTQDNEKNQRISVINIFLDNYECIFNDSVVVMNPQLITNGSSFDKDLQRYFKQYILKDSTNLQKDKLVIISQMVNITNQCQINVSFGQFRSYLYKGLLYLKQQKNDNHLKIGPFINKFDGYIANLIERDQRTNSANFNMFFKHAIMYCQDFKDEVQLLQELASRLIKIVKQAIKQYRSDIVAYLVGNLIRELINNKEALNIQTKCHLFANESLGSYMFLIKQLNLDFNYFNQFEKFTNSENISFHSIRVTQEFMQNPRNKIHIQVQQELRNRLKRIMEYLQKQSESKMLKADQKKKRNKNKSQQQSESLSVQKSVISKQSYESQKMKQPNQMEVEEVELEMAEQGNYVPLRNDYQNDTEVEFYSSDSEEY
ncbi:hypothetical protein pb186bvf_003319 [Paramecium bursaria]